LNRIPIDPEEEEDHQRVWKKKKSECFNKSSTTHQVDRTERVKSRVDRKKKLQREAVKEAGAIELKKRDDRTEEKNILLL
jgi:hypothetical protein